MTNLHIYLSTTNIYTIEYAYRKTKFKSKSDLFYFVYLRVLYVKKNSCHKKRTIHSLEPSYKIN